MGWRAAGETRRDAWGGPRWGEPKADTHNHFGVRKSEPTRPRLSTGPLPPIMEMIFAPRGDLSFHFCFFTHLQVSPNNG